jgi:hypothetical protein
MLDKLKALCVIAIAVVMVFVMASCSCGTPIESVDAKEKPTSMFIVVEETASWKIVYHRDTGVMYAISFGGYNSGNFTLLVNADGTPMVYEGGRP